MALDLGGTNFRVLVIDIDGDDFNMENEIFAIPQSIMTGTGEQVRVVAIINNLPAMHQIDRSLTFSFLPQK